ncbi:hypothetical protein Ddye_006382 [Dipteronia dyeriana]|uniref:RRM domain-containing protein n=1 Tax=Dipteronia dyeriana TaxID=168575 RepID=A0AAD9XI20_9ROSI|nr:hypothetical protein Ddye_006382 [Dipteronia dyeriana]
MMREDRERSSDSYNHERYSDFREKLYSIYLNNLNPKVYQVCLWGLFKTFGKVRDIYLSAAIGFLKRGFAFVRFVSLEEARKVAEMTNGMHVYGWPISTKVAQYGWNKKRLSGSRASRVEKWNEGE